MKVTISLMDGASVAAALQAVAAPKMHICYESGALHIIRPGIDWQLPGVNSLDMVAGLLPATTHSQDGLALGYFIAAGIVVIDGVFD